MREGLAALGPTELFSGPMAALLERPIKQIICIGTCTFTKLNFKHPAGTPTIPVDPDDPHLISFPALYIISYVESFRLLTGTCQVIYEI